MEFTREQRREAVRKASQEVKDFIYSDEFSSLMSEIGKKYNFLLDKLAQLEDEIVLVSIGLKSATNFVKNVSDKLNLDQNTAVRLGDDVNRTIFSRARIALGEPVVNDPQIQKDSSIDRDALLAEIENPTPVAAPITVNTGGPMMPKEVVAEPVRSKESVANEFIAGKLTETVNLPSQKTVIAPEPTLKNPEPEKPKPKYAVDPYREPLA